MGEEIKDMREIIAETLNKNKAEAPKESMPAQAAEGNRKRQKKPLER